MSPSKYHSLQPEDGGNITLQNVGILPQTKTILRMKNSILKKQTIAHGPITGSPQLKSLFTQQNQLFTAA
jgi:hypothetical protein